MARKTFTTIRRAPWVDTWIETLIGTGAVMAAALLALTIVIGLVQLDVRVGGGLGVVVFCVFMGSVFLFEERIRRAAKSPGLNRGTVVVGNEGVVVCTTFRRHVVSFAALRSVEHQGEQWVLFVAENKRIRVRVAERKALLLSVDAALERFRERPTATSVPSLSRRSERVEMWLERLQKAEGQSYRTEAVTPDLLVRVAEDPSAAREQRIGAATRLQRAPDSQKQRVRVSIEETADEHLAEALALALGGSTDPEAIKRGLGKRR